VRWRPPHDQTAPTGTGCFSGTRQGHPWLDVTWTMTMMNHPRTIRPRRKADPDQVIARYQELHHLERTGLKFGITRERVRQIVNRAGISTAPIPKPKPKKPDRRCQQCGAPVPSTHTRYCATHGTPQQKNWRRYQRLKAHPDQYAHWQQSCTASRKRRRARIREGTQQSLR
jgi:hypothetical protein